MDNWWDVDMRDETKAALGRVRPGWVWPAREGVSFVGGMCVHHSAGAPGVKPLAVVRAAARRGMSSAGVPFGYHFVIAEDGAIHYMIDIRSVVYHNGGTLSDDWYRREPRWSEANGTTVGVCLVGNFIGGHSPTRLQMDALRWAARHIGGNVTGHKDWKNTQCPGDWWSADALDELDPSPRVPTRHPGLEETIRDQAWEAIRGRAWAEAGIEYNPAAALMRFAARENMGRPITAEFDVGDLRCQGYAGGIVYARIGHWDEIEWVDWLPDF